MKFIKIKPVPKYKFLAAIKRCVGLPGDTVEVRGGRLFVNNTAFDEPPSVRMPYGIKVNSPEIFRKTLKEEGVWGRWKSQDELEAILTLGQAEKYTNNKMVDSINPAIVDYAYDIFPGKSFLHHPKWTIDDYGPYVLPWKGMKIDIDAVTDNHYWRLINEREGNERGLKVCGNRLCMADSLATSYEFKKDYYFFMGDNRHDSNDSRYWGPVQEDKLIGKADAILFSKSDKGGRWNRIFKPIN